MAQTPQSTEPGPTTPGIVQDMRNTSDIRLVMIEVGKVEERVNFLIEDNKSHRADFRLTWGALVAGFLVLAGLFLYGYNRLADKFEETTKAVTKVDTKIDDLILRLPPAANAPAQKPK
jgi:hypothetical protein